MRTLPGGMALELRCVGRIFSSEGLPPRRDIESLLIGQTRSVYTSSSLNSTPTQCNACARVTRHRQTKSTERWLDVLAGYLRNLARSAVVGIIAHELAHVFLQRQAFAAEEQPAGELQADDLTRQWGFVKGVEASGVWKRTT